MIAMLNGFNWFQSTKKKTVIDFKHFHGILKEWDRGPLSHKFANGRQAIDEGQGYFAQGQLLRGILPVVLKWYYVLT